MKIVLLIIAFTYCLIASELVLKSNYKIKSNIHLVDAISYKEKNYHALIEIPAGSTQKWEVNHKSGHLEWEFKNNKPREVEFLGYPGNYGFIPQTILNKKDGGDGDPLDIIVLGSSLKKGTLQKVKILGAIKLLDSGEDDDKIIAVPVNSPFKDINSLGEMMVKHHGIIEIVRLWFEGYKGSKIHFMGYMEAKDAKAMVEKAHLSWKKQKNH